MKTVARRHHYLPQGYLAGFTDTGEKEGKLYALEIKTARGFKTSPKNIAAERDFNRIDIDGKDPDVIEKALSTFEDQAVGALRCLAKTNALPQGDDFSHLMNLLGLLAIRNPQIRKSFNNFRERVAHRFAELLVSNKEIWHYHVAKARAAGAQIPEDISFEKMRDFVEGKRYTIELGTEGNLRSEFHTLDRLLPFFARRRWSVLIADDTAPDFICSDYPVTLVWKDPACESPIGFGLRQTEVVLPLNRRQALFGVFEDPLPVVVRVDVVKVGELNARTVLNAERQIYCATESFTMQHEGRLIEVKYGQRDHPPARR